MKDLTNIKGSKKMTVKHSFIDNDEKRWTACCECNKGGNGFAKDKCSSGWMCKKWNGLGCFMGEEIAKR